VTGQLAVRDLTFGYRRGAPAVFAEVSHDFAPGALTAVTGPSGSGKSTLLYVLGLMLTPSAGSVTWGGQEVTSWPDGDRSRLRAAQIGFVFQDAILDPARTALDNVAEAASLAGMTRAETTRVALELMGRFGVAERAHHRPGEVSGGQAQRIALCRALVKSPALLLADEPTGKPGRRLRRSGVGSAARSGKRRRHRRGGHPRRRAGRAGRPPRGGRRMRPGRVLAAAVRDALGALRGQRVAAAVSTLVVAGATTAILATTGQTVATERRVLAEINSPAARLLVLTDDQGQAGLDAASLPALVGLDGVEWAIGFGLPVDVTNANVPGGPPVPARQVYGDWPHALTPATYRPLTPGDAVVGAPAAARLGLIEPVGGVRGAELHAPVVGTFTAAEPLTDLGTGVLITADPAPGTLLRSVMLSVENVRDLDVVTRAARTVLVAEDPTRLSVRTSAELADLQQVIGSQLAQTSRQLVWIVLAAGMVLVAATQFGAISTRARDYGRRRALGATRTGILVHVLLQVGVCALIGAALGTTAGLLLDWRIAGSSPLSVVMV